MNGRINDEKDKHSLRLRCVLNIVPFKLSFAEEMARERERGSDRVMSEEINFMAKAQRSKHFLAVCVCVKRQTLL